MAIDYKAKDIRKIAHFSNCTGKWYTTVKESYSYLEKSNLLSRETVLAIV